MKPNKKAGLIGPADCLTPMPDRKARAERRAQHAAEVKASQAKLRASIAETERLVGESDMMLRRHRKECDDHDAREDQARKGAEPRPEKSSQDPPR